LPASLLRLLLVAVACAASLLPSRGGATADRLTIGSARGSMDFFIGDSLIFRTTGGFKSWEGKIQVDDLDVTKSSVDVIVHTSSIEMLDKQQTTMLREPEFFDVEKFPEMTYRSTAIERINADTLKVEGEITLRGITRPMTLDAKVIDRIPDAAPGKRTATFRAEGSLKRSEFGMTKYIDLVGDKVDIAIRTDAWR
jgi:polyisoprenoid-binding protein YceI